MVAVYAQTSISLISLRRPRPATLEMLVDNDSIASRMRKSLAKKRSGPVLRHEVDQHWICVATWSQNCARLDERIGRGCYYLSPYFRILDFEIQRYFLILSAWRTLLEHTQSCTKDGANCESGILSFLKHAGPYCIR
jgi:hypothetical protein